jgi:hypothetical protein
MSELRFKPGIVVATPGALQAFADSGDDLFPYLLKHLALDPGDLSPEDICENELSVREGFRILSAFTLSNGSKIWIITETDRSSTCFLLPSEY